MSKYEICGKEVKRRITFKGQKVCNGCSLALWQEQFTPLEDMINDDKEGHHGGIAIQSTSTNKSVAR